LIETKLSDGSQVLSVSLARLESLEIKAWLALAEPLDSLVSRARLEQLEW